MSGHDPRRGHEDPRGAGLAISCPACSAAPGDECRLSIPGRATPMHAVRPWVATGGTPEGFLVYMEARAITRQAARS